MIIKRNRGSLSLKSNIIARKNMHRNHLYCKEFIDKSNKNYKDFEVVFPKGILKKLKSGEYLLNKKSGTDEFLAFVKDKKTNNIVSSYENPEDINSSPETAPSKRLLKIKKQVQCQAYLKYCFHSDEPGMVRLCWMLPIKCFQKGKTIWKLQHYI